MKASEILEITSRDITEYSKRHETIRVNFKGMKSEAFIAMVAEVITQHTEETGEDEEEILDNVKGVLRNARVLEDNNVTPQMFIEALIEAANEENK